MYVKSILGLLVLSFLGVHTGWAATLMWDANTESDLAGYRIYYGTMSRSQGDYTDTIVIHDKNATTYNFTPPMGTYFLAMTAFNESGNESNYSEEVSITSSAPEAVSVTFLWNLNTESDLAGYRIYYGTSPRSQADYPTSIAIHDKNATSWTLDLENGTYYLALTAFDESGNESGYSAEVSTVVSGTEVLGKPGRPILIQ